MIRVDAMSTPIFRAVNSGRFKEDELYSKEVDVVRRFMSAARIRGAPEELIKAGDELIKSLGAAGHIVSESQAALFYLSVGTFKEMLIELYRLDTALRDATPNVAEVRESMEALDRTKRHLNVQIPEDAPYSLEVRCRAIDALDTVKKVVSEILDKMEAG